MSEIFPPMTDVAASKAILAGDGNPENTTTNRLHEAGFFVPKTPYDKYMRMHKRLVGPGTADTLLAIHDELAASLHVEHLATAGWAAAEAGLVAIDRPIEDRLEYMRMATESWDAAIERQQFHNARRGLPDEYENANVNRLLLSRIFVPLMEGMVRGDVSKEAREEVYGDLVLLAEQNAYGLTEAENNRRECGPFIGLAHEINAMLAVNRLKSPTLIAMPATARADSGEFYPEQTHDIELLHLYRGAILDVTTIESKSRPRPKHYMRYEAAIVGGRVHLFTKTGTSPVDTVQLFLKEYEGSTTDDEQNELEQMTDTIVHVVRHRRSGAPGLEARCYDIETCETIPRQRSGTRAMGNLAIAS